MSENLAQSISSIIPASVRNSARETILDQPDVPLSPVRRMTSGKFELCAAAALLVATASTASDRNKIIQKLEEDGLTYLTNAFEDLGWTKELGSHIRLMNDGLSPSIRKREILKIFDIDTSRQSINTDYTS